ncbi:LOW QUALITY PROTEIN: hypothetical protein V2J09_009347 [Rumex salicifolius]
MLNESNLKVWKENVEIALGCMDLDLMLRTERPILPEDNFNEAKMGSFKPHDVPFWKHFRALFLRATNAKESLEAIQQYFAKNEKAQTSNHSNEAKVERWDRSNRMSLMIMKRSIPEEFWGSIS